MIRRLPHLATLVVVWVALWQDVSIANVLSGLLLSVTLLFFFRSEPRRMLPIRPIAATRFLLYFLWKLVQASVIVAWEVATPRNRINEGIVAISIRGPSDGLVTLVANAISLTPGTLTVDARRDPAVLYVHVLHLGEVDELRREVLHLEMLAIRAFGPREAVTT